ncbi:MAG: mucoidy inhibitor MuiA family protein [Bacteroidetes bacterium]|nr:mucoidy inhibitor MuiA family protein [Bacteroidota bacterium]
MKRFVISAFILTLMAYQAKADNEKNVKTKPEKVTVYLAGAQVFRNSPVTLAQGMNQVVFEGLENDIDPGSIQAGGNGNFIITEVQHLVKYPELEKLKNTGDVKYQKIIRQLNDSLTEIGYTEEELKNKMDVLNTERNVLLNYRLYKGESKKDTLAFLKDGLVFLREKLFNINAEMLKLKKESQKVAATRARINERLQEINNDLGASNSTVDISKPNYCVVISVLADAAGTGTVNVNYFVNSAGWTPNYDLRTSGIESPVKLTYKAMVHQNTGIDWTSVKLTLSTANPHQSLTLPELGTWYIDQVYYPKKQVKDKKREALSYNAPTTAAANGASGGMADMEKEAGYAYEYTTVDENVIQAEFEIKLPYTIPGDNKEHYVAVLSKDLDTKYMYKAIPKLDQNVYLTARIVNWEDLNLLPGEAKIFYDGTYIGETALNTGGVEDTLVLSLGADKNVAIKRTKVKDKNKEKILDNDKVYYSTYEIVVRNGNSKNIDIMVEDQLPLSRNKSVVIEKTDISGASYDELSGKLSWKQTIKTKDTKKLSFSYTVRAPKDMPIVMR